MNRILKKIPSWILVVAIVISMLPLQVLAATNPLTLTLRSEEGTLIEGAVVTATVNSSWGGGSTSLQVVEAGNGKYTIYRDNYTSRWYTITINVTHPDYESAASSVRASSTSTTITMAPVEIVEVWQEFEMFYFLNGSETDPFPASYAAAGDIGNYGPSGDNTPFVILNVNITKLEQEYSDVVLYGENTAEGNSYQFTPTDDSDRMAASKAFWEAVIACADEESLAALEETGLKDWFVGYVAKFDGNSYHIDGILEVTPPVYSIELYKDDTEEGGSYSYVGGLLTNNGEEFHTMEDVLVALEGYLGYTITWQEDEDGKPIAENGVYTGTYIHEKSLHTITVYQSNAAAAATQPEGSEISYEEKSSYYYVAYYVLKIEKGNQVEFAVTYTDGDANDTAFTEHSYGVTHTGNTYPNVPAFTGAAVREGYTFLGWILEGGDGTILSDAQVQVMTVTSDMVFHAEWEPIPITHIGAVHVILNGTYNAADHTATGTLIDINTVTGNQVQLYLKEQNGTEYIPLVAREGEIGIYEAVLENGSYTIHYSLDGGNTIEDTDDQLLTIDNADRHRYLFFNSVEYDLNGGEAAADFPIGYYQTGMTHLHVTDRIPTKDRYVFSHWTDQDGNVYAPGALLTEEISKPYVLTAQWKDAVDLYLNIQIVHIASDGISHNNDSGMHDIFFTLDQREGTGDYTEIYTKTIRWDGKSEFTDSVYEAAYLRTDSDYTVYTSQVPVLEDVDKASEYTFTTTKSGYSLVSINTETAENGDRTINVVLQFDPNDFDFVYKVSLDEEAKQLPDSFKPVAANVKVISWCDTPNDEDYGLEPGDDTVDWYTITQQRYTYERVVLDANGEGTGSFPVWICTTDSETPLNWYYRIEVVSFEMPDGSINPATNVNGTNETYISDCKHVEANVVVTGGQVPDASATNLAGAYYEDDQQQGEVEAIISVHTYSVTFVPNGGTLLGTTENTVVEPLFQVPHLEDYIPVREGGYVFDGWYMADGEGNITTIPGESFMPLYYDVTLIAKWKEPLTITANVAISTTYQQTNADGSVTEHTIHDKERATHATVSLQKILENGYPETITVKTVDLAYGEKVGAGTVTFTQVPDDGHTYRVLVIAQDYTFVYQNEPDSLDAAKMTDYAGSYNVNDFTAEYDGDTLAVINAYGEFTPVAFDLQYEVDADAIGADFRPAGAQILITHDDDTGILNPNQWPVISQMEYGDSVVGQDTELVDGLGSGSFPVWRSYPDGRTAEYALRLQSTTTDGVRTLYDPSEAPFSVTYYVPAYYVEPNSQSQMLIAELIPNVYPIVYELDGGTMSGTYPTEHTWSYETQLSDAVPAKQGYVFDGWYLDEALTVPAGETIDAAVCTETILYAKWKLAMDKVNLTVVIDHIQGNAPDSLAGQAAAYDRILYAQLTSHPEGGEDAAYAPVEGTQKAYDSSYWHTTEHGTEVEEFSVGSIYTELPSDMAYSALVTMEGYQIVPEECSVTPNYDEESETGTTYDVVVYLKYYPELLDIQYTVRMDESVDPELDPASAMVRITSWYNEPTTEYALNWYPITQQKETYMTVALDEETRSGTGTYQVWQWYLKEQNIPFYYRIEVIGLVLDDGTVVDMLPQEPNVSYTGGIYTATVYAENGAAVPVPQDETYQTSLTGIYGQRGDDGLEQVGTLEAVITTGEPFKVVFHSNNADAREGDVFRTYYAAGAALPEGSNYHLTGKGEVSVFYDIPTFAYDVHNGYIFKGWYMGTEEDAAPMDFAASYTEETHIYAHWIYVDKVDKEEDGKIYESDQYSEYDLMGNQIRTAQLNPDDHYGDAAPGMRFITSLSERVYQEMNGIHSNNAGGVEYGFVIAFTSMAQAKATGEDYMLKYKHASLNGEDTTTSYSYVNNVPCRLAGVPVADHYAGEQYRLYTAVITYNGLEGEALINAQNTGFIGRAYMRYFDANGLERVHYNNYTGNSKTYGGVNTCYTQVSEMVKGQ